MGAVADVLQDALRALGDRRRKLEPFVDEIKDIELVERDLRKTVGKLKNRGRTGGAVTASTDTVAVNVGATSTNGGTNRDRALEALAGHPDGISGAKLGELAGIPHGSLYQLLNDLVSDGLVEKVGRGFYRLAVDANGDPINANLSDEEKEALGGRALA